MTCNVMKPIAKKHLRLLPKKISKIKMKVFLAYNTKASVNTGISPVIRRFVKTTKLPSAQSQSKRLSYCLHLTLKPMRIYLHNGFKILPRLFQRFNVSLSRRLYWFLFLYTIHMLKDCLQILLPIWLQLIDIRYNFNDISR